MLLVDKGWPLYPDEIGRNTGGFMSKLDSDIFEVTVIEGCEQYTLGYFSSRKKAATAGLNWLQKNKLEVQEVYDFGFCTAGDVDENYSIFITPITLDKALKIHCLGL